MKRIKIGRFMLRIGFVLYVLENFYFGWNKLPMSDLELYADNVVRFFLYAGLMFCLMPIWDLYENYVKRNEK